MSCPVYEIDPLQDPRWTHLADSHSLADVFHTRGWMAALHATYGFRVRALTTSPPGAGVLTDGLPFCEVRSPWTGKRLVCLPFSDYCGSLGSEKILTDGLRAKAEERKVRYAEVRAAGTAAAPDGYSVSQKFLRHAVPLEGGPDAVYRRFHKDSVVRKIRRAEREGLRIEKSVGEEALEAFYRLFVRTRRRLGYPPPPLRWFRNVIAFAAPGAASIHLARTPGGEAIGTLFLLRHRATVYYKYGASDERFHPLGPMPFLFWNAMREGCEQGLTQMDLGRSDLDGSGLAEFKRRLGGVQADAEYWRTPQGPAAAPGSSSGSGRMASAIFRRLPERLLISLGSALYPHIA